MKTRMMFVLVAALLFAPASWAQKSPFDSRDYPQPTCKMAMDCQCETGYSAKCWGGLCYCTRTHVQPPGSSIHGMGMAVDVDSPFGKCLIDCHSNRNLDPTTCAQHCTGVQKAMEEATRRCHEGCQMTPDPARRGQCHSTCKGGDAAFCRFLQRNVTAAEWTEEACEKAPAPPAARPAPSAPKGPAYTAILAIGLPAALLIIAGMLLFLRRRKTAKK